MKKSLLSFLIAFIFLINGVMGQRRVLSGTVTDQADGASIPGVSVLVKGTNTGTYTDGDGKYSISVSQVAILVFKSVGYLDKEVKIGTSNQFFVM